MRWFARTEQLLGEEAFERLTQARVAIYGLGGVIIPFIGIKLLDLLVSVWF